MKRLLILAPLAWLVLSGCATTGFLGFLATTKYVNGKVEASSSEARSGLEETRTDLEQMRAEVTRFKELTGQVEGLLAEIARTRETTEELRRLTGELESRIKGLPEETLRELAGLIQAYLDSKDQ